jgi:hypothetical protein
MVWVLVLMTYLAPAIAINWDGPWRAGTIATKENVLYRTEAECRNDAIQAIGRLHQGMLVPMRFQCVPFPSMLPKGAPR